VRCNGTTGPCSMRLIVTALIGIGQSKFNEARRVGGASGSDNTRPNNSLSTSGGIVDRLRVGCGGSDRACGRVKVPLVEMHTCVLVRMGTVHARDSDEGTCAVERRLSRCSAAENSSRIAVAVPGVWSKAVEE
jgi:hypothetical protein